MRFLFYFNLFEDFVNFAWKYEKDNPLFNKNIIKIVDICFIRLIINVFEKDFHVIISFSITFENGISEVYTI